MMIVHLTCIAQSVLDRKNFYHFEIYKIPKIKYGADKLKHTLHDSQNIIIFIIRAFTLFSFKDLGLYIYKKLTYLRYFFFCKCWKIQISS